MTEEIMNVASDTTEVSTNLVSKLKDTKVLIGLGVTAVIVGAILVVEKFWKKSKNEAELPAFVGSETTESES